MPLFKYPKESNFGRVIAKSKLALHLRPTNKVRDLLTKHIERITWSHLLGKDSVPLAPTAEVPEINVFRLELRNDRCPDDILAYLDRAIPKPSFYELAYDGRICMAGTYKRPSRSRPGEVRTFGYYSTSWVQEEGSIRQDLPVELDLEQLYHALAASLLPISVKSGEHIEAAYARAEAFAKTSRELERVQARRRREKQFNLRIELNAEIKRLEGEVEGLKC